MKVEHLYDLLNKLDKNDEVYCLLYLRDEADDAAEMAEIAKPSDEEWIGIVRYMDTDDGIYEEANNSFQWAIDKMEKKREAKNETRPISAEVAIGL